MKPRRLLPVVCVCVALAGCSSSDDDGANAIEPFVTTARIYSLTQEDGDLVVLTDDVEALDCYTATLELQLVGDPDSASIAYVRVRAEHYGSFCSTVCSPGTGTTLRLEIPEELVDLEFMPHPDTPPIPDDLMCTPLGEVPS